MQIILTFPRTEERKITLINLYSFLPYTLINTISPLQAYRESLNYNFKCITAHKIWNIITIKINMP